MDEADFINVGFNKNEAKVYISLLKFREATANHLIRKTKFHKNIVYDNLEKLIDKGLVTYIIENGIKIFKTAPSNMLLEFIEERQIKLTQQKEKVKIIVKEIEQLPKKITHKQDAEIYRGKQGIRTFYKELLKIGKEYVVFGAPDKSVSVMGEVFWRNFDAKRNELGLKCKMLFNYSLKKYGKSIIDKITEVRFFEKNFEPLTETHIQDDQVAIIVWTEEPILFLIKDKIMAKSYAIYFEKMWKDSKK